MGNESFLAFTTSHLSLAEQNLARYRLRVVKPPKLPLEKKPNPDKDGPDIEPNLWMWVNANVVYPPGKLQAPRRKAPTSTLHSAQPSLKEEDPSCSKVTVAESLPPSSHKQSLPWKWFASSPRDWEGSQWVDGFRNYLRHWVGETSTWWSQASAPSYHWIPGVEAMESGPVPTLLLQLPEEEEEEEAEDQDDSSSVALPSPHKKAPLQSRRLRQANSQEGRLWPRPPLNYFHLIALALRNSPPCGLNVQQIYTFTRQHFPFFQTAPEGWKNTIRHNLCFRDSFEKVPVSVQAGATTRPRPCLWRLTEEGHRRFAEEARALVSTQLESIQQCMSQPDMMPFLFELEPF